jgi:putative hemolysin
LSTDSEPYQQVFLYIQQVIALDANLLILGIGGLLIIIAFLFLSALFSSSENAFFSLSPNDLVVLNEENSSSSKTALDLINEPDRKTGTRRLLATILLMNNLINIFIVIYSSYLFERLFDPYIANDVVKFLIQVVAITFILVMVGEIIPKIYATQNNLKIVRLMAKPLQLCQTIFKPLVLILSASSSLFDKYLQRKTHNISVEELSQAIDIADEDKEIEEKHILKGIINFGNTSVKQIMKPRTEVMCLEQNTDAQELMKLVREWNYSRIPVYEDTFDQVKGLLYLKDLIPYLHKNTNFDWLKLLKPPFYVPEHKKIDDLLEEFQEKRVHMAIVVDEYGGTSGIVTMEDILEEIFGEMKDEFDDDELTYSKLDESTYIFEGKTTLNDILKILELPQYFFDETRGDADTLAGLLMEVLGEIPGKGREIKIEHITFTVESADNRRIKRVKLYISEELKQEADDENE